MKRLLTFLLLLTVSVGANAQFTNGQILTAQSLNAALAAPTITGGSINGTPIGASVPTVGYFTNLTATILTATTGTVTNLTGTNINATNITATGSVSFPGGTVSPGSLSPQAGNTLLGNSGGSSASPAAITVPSCSTSNSAVKYTSNTGFSCGTTFALTSGTLGQFSSTTSAQLAGIISDETGSGSAVFATSPSLITPHFSSIINTGTLTLPTLTDTLVGRVTTDTLTNKTLTSPAISGGSITGLTSFVSPGFASFGNQTTWLNALISCTTSCSQTWSQSTGGGSGLLGATRTSDNSLAGSQAAQGVAGYAINDNTTQVQTAYGSYFEARHLTGTGTTQVSEMDIVNQGSVVDIDPYQMIQTGTTPDLWLSSGRPDVTTGAANATAAIGIINNNTLFDSGIVFQSNAITVNSGEAKAIQMAPNDALLWYSAANTIVSRIRSDATSASLGIVFANGQLNFNTIGGTQKVSFDTSGDITAAGNVSADSTTYLLGNIAGQTLPGNNTSVGTNSIGWNYTNGGGETDFVNAKGGGGSGGFRWYEWSGSAATLTGTLDGSGDLILPGSLTPSQTAGIVGTTTNNNANTGSVGEFQSASASSISLTTATAATLTSVSLTAGDWDVSGTCVFSPAATSTVQQIECGVGTTAATVPVSNTGQSTITQSSFGTGAAQYVSTPTWRLSIAATTTLYLSAQTVFGVSTMSSSGFVRARRVR